MLQNRVDPYGDIIKTQARGAWMGNRGVLHNDRKEIIRPYKLKNWITCVLQFKGRHREVMTANRYTELFFLDEATAFSAGHRPCAECRREDHKLFKELWLKGSPEYGFNHRTSIEKIDAIIHSERVSTDRSKVTYAENLNKLPTGTFVFYEDNPYLLKENKMYLWTPGGYDKAMDLPNINEVTVLTPKSIVRTFQTGYLPQMAT